MLKLLTDEHLSPAIAPAVRKRSPDATILCLHDWREGHFLGASDALVLREVATEGLTLVTFDVRAIPPLLKNWAEQGSDHTGVIFVDRRSYAQNDVGGIARALATLWSSHGKEEWRNRYFFL
ncbi:MAG: DUF5615 family PIN-like protein [Verrucomicrobiota bacterium]